MSKNVVHILSIFLVAALLASCTTAPTNPSLVTDAGHRLDGDELLVLDPPADYLRHLPDLGMEVLDVTDLPGIGSKLYHLRLTDGAHPHHGRDRHRQRFPGVIVDAHHHYEHHAAKKARVDKTYTARKAANWTSEKRSCSKGIRIGVIDGMVDVKHKAFKGTKITYRSFHLKGEKLAHSGHGTAVTSVITGRGAWAGLLPGAEIFAANVFHKNKAGKPVGSAKSIVRAIDWMHQNKVPIINLSLGGGSNILVASALGYVAKKGTVLIASAGNSGPFAKRKDYPGAYPSTIAITAVDRFNRNARFATRGKYIDFAAPGVDIWTAVPGGGKAMSGTSFSAPIFTAFAAAAMKRLGLKSPDELRAYFKKHAKDMASPGHDKYTGWGVVQVPPIC